MAKQKPTPVTHVYKEVNEGNYKDVKHYELQEVFNGKNQFSTLINISRNRKFAKSKPIYWIKIRENNKWVKPCLTGLFKTPKKYTYKGDTKNRTNLVIFKFSDNASTLTIDFYPNFYTNDLSRFLQ